LSRLLKPAKGWPRKRIKKVEKVGEYFEGWAQQGEEVQADRITYNQKKKNGVVPSFLKSWALSGR